MSDVFRVAYRQAVFANSCSFVFSCHRHCLKWESVKFATHHLKNWTGINNLQFTVASTIVSLGTVMRPHLQQVQGSLSSRAVLLFPLLFKHNSTITSLDPLLTPISSTRLYKRVVLCKSLTTLKQNHVYSTVS